MSDKECESKLARKLLTKDSFDRLITSDVDAFSNSGEMLLKFRKNVLSFDKLKAAYENFKGGIMLTEARGAAAGESFKRTRADGSTTNTTVNKHVETGAVGYMDQNAMVRYCRKTAWTGRNFEMFEKGIPFVEEVNELYKQLCPDHYARQYNIARGTNRNYVIRDTAFTTVTVNMNFQTAVHKDSGDFQRGFGNLAVYREGDWTGGYFVLPQYRVAVDMQNCDMLFVDVHKWHGNTPFENFDPAPTDFSNRVNHPMKDKYTWTGKDLRFSFVMYYREYMINCKQPSEELHNTQMEQGGFLKL